MLNAVPLNPGKHQTFSIATEMKPDFLQRTYFSLAISDGPWDPLDNRI